MRTSPSMPRKNQASTSRRHASSASATAMVRRKSTLVVTLSLLTVLQLCRLDQRGELAWRHRQVRVADNYLQFVPILRYVEVHAEPAARANVGRPEEAIRRGSDKPRLRIHRRGAPEREPVVVMVIG